MPPIDHDTPTTLSSARSGSTSPDAETISSGLRIADEAMLAALRCHGIGLPDGSGYSLTNDGQSEVARLSEADPILIEAVTWLVRRGLVNLVSDDLGEVVILRRSDADRKKPAALPATTANADTAAEARPTHSWSLDAETAHLLASTIMGDLDHPSPITLRVGPIRDDDGTVESGLYVFVTDYPEEGCIMLVADPPAAGAAAEQPERARN